MKFHDIVYKNFGSVREKLKKEYENDIKEKLEQQIENYAIFKGIIYGKIKAIST